MWLWRLDRFSFPRPALSSHLFLLLSLPVPPLPLFEMVKVSRAGVTNKLHTST